MCCILHAFHAAPTCATERNATVVGEEAKARRCMQSDGSGTDTISLRNNLPNGGRWRIGSRLALNSKRAGVDDGKSCRHFILAGPELFDILTNVAKLLPQTLFQAFHD